jgi:DNA recombination protein RmuC
MTITWYLISFAAGAVLTAVIIRILKKDNSTDFIQKNFKDNRDELSNSLRANREEIGSTIGNLTEKIENKLLIMNESLNKSSRDDRDEMTKSIQSFQQSFITSTQDIGRKQEELIKVTESKLEKMRETVDEKLHKTLEEKLGRSFKMVNDQLQAVQLGLGEMQTLASGVGDLKKVLSNVKTRGVLGEIQLGNILEEMLSPEQYEANVKTKKGSNDLVEFAVKLPGSGNNKVYLPIDAKFPLEDYARLQGAYEAADAALIESSTKSLLQSVKKFAKDIRDKYIDPPYTTDFGILFLPIEGLFAEIARQPGLIECLQRDFKITIAGPTTMGMILNSFQMGFKTLAIQQRSSEVWKILSSVKAEFGTFGKVLEKTQQKLHEANNELDKLVTTRTNAISRQLREVEDLPSLPDTKGSLESLVE